MSSYVTYYVTSGDRVKYLHCQFSEPGLIGYLCDSDKVHVPGVVISAVNCKDDGHAPTFGWNFSDHGQCCSGSIIPPLPLESGNCFQVSTDGKHADTA